MQQNKLTLILIWALRIAASLILLQTLFFKFTAAPESVYIFTQVGMEPWGRIGSGIVELIAACLILYPKTTGVGAMLGLGTMSGAIFFHLTKLGISIPNNDGTNDGGLLFAYALIVFISCLILAIIYRNQIFKLVLNRF